MIITTTKWSWNENRREFRFVSEDLEVISYPSPINVTYWAIIQLLQAKPIYAR